MSPVMTPPIEARLTSVGLSLDEVYACLFAGEYIEAFDIEVQRPLTRLDRWMGLPVIYRARLEFRDTVNGRGYIEAEVYGRRHLGPTLRRLLALRRGPVA